MEEKYEQAKKRVKQLKAFYNHLLIYVIINALLFVINFFVSPGTWWFYWVTIFWGIAVLWQGMEIVSRNRFLGKDWEDKKIKEYMGKKEE
ncbi:MAG: 2TM domain-containing protein [Methanobacteriaceae archaeon]|jgi:uncharacterized membrane protein YdbT with pleckstrin-like domain|nr:2TM domain-containing protein [Methanobacteriaceae archaeon]MDO9627460.1 2TM domain-containing protein [Methanobacteriaceae archaeon]